MEIFLLFRLSLLCWKSIIPFEVAVPAEVGNDNPRAKVIELVPKFALCTTAHEIANWFVFDRYTPLV